MRLLFCLISLCGAFSYCFSNRNPELDSEWELFKSTYEKNYTEKEESFRKQVWEKNMKFINDQNLLYKEGKLSYYLGMNNLGDLTDKEFKIMLNPSILQRGRCGSCWAFSATGAVEGQLFLKTGKLVELSKQNLIDCSKFQGCRGGTVTSAFKYIKKNEGIVSEECYPYVAKKNSLCSYRSECAAVKIRDYVVLPFGNEEILMEAVAIVGPVSVSLNAQKSLHFYKGGIYVEPKCKPRYTNHALLLVGYGYKEGTKDKKSRLEEENQYEETKFWILKNSWGVNWGKKGYVYIAKDKNNHCGVATRAIYPIL